MNQNCCLDSGSMHQNWFMDSGAMNQNWFMVSGAMDQDALAGRWRGEKGGKAMNQIGSRALALRAREACFVGGKSYESNWFVVSGAMDQDALWAPTP